MKYSDFFRAKRNGEKIPTAEPLKWNKDQKAHMEKGMCVNCGLNPSGKNSHLCSECESKYSIAEVRKEIAGVRKKILK